MSNVNKNESGFSVVETVLVLVIVVLVGVVGYMVYKNHHQAAVTSTANKSVAPTTKTTPKTQSTNPYAGWNSYSLPIEKLSIKYPVGWTLSNSPPVPTQDNITLTAKDGFTINIEDGTSNGGDYIPLVSGSPMNVSYLGQTEYLVFVNGRNANGPGYDSSIVSGAVLLTNPSDQSAFNTDKYAVGPNNTTGAVNAKYMLVTCSTQSSDLSLAQAQNYPDYNTCKLVIQSMQY